MVLPNFFLQLFQTQETPPKQTFGELPDSEKGRGGTPILWTCAKVCTSLSLLSNSCVRKSLCALCVCVCVCVRERFSTWVTWCSFESLDVSFGRYRSVLEILFWLPVVVKKIKKSLYHFRLESHGREGQGDMMRMIYIHPCTLKFYVCDMMRRMIYIHPCTLKFYVCDMMRMMIYIHPCTPKFYVCDMMRMMIHIHPCTPKFYVCDMMMRMIYIHPCTPKFDICDMMRMTYIHPCTLKFYVCDMMRMMIYIHPCTPKFDVCDMIRMMIYIHPCSPKFYVCG